jgi:hypothetical protein
MPGARDIDALILGPFKMGAPDGIVPEAAASIRISLVIFGSREACTCKSACPPASRAPFIRAAQDIQSGKTRRNSTTIAFFFIIIPYNISGRRW